MSGIAFVAEQLIIDKISSIFAKPSQTSSLCKAFTFAAGFLSLIGVLFLIFASHLWLQDHYRTDVAAALTGLISLFIASIIIAASLIILHLRKTALQKLRHDIHEVLTEIINGLNDFIEDPVRANPKISAVGAFIIGLMAAYKTRS